MNLLVQMNPTRSMFAICTMVCFEDGDSQELLSDLLPARLLPVRRAVLWIRALRGTEGTAPLEWSLLKRCTELRQRRTAFLLSRLPSLSLGAPMYQILAPRTAQDIIDGARDVQTGRWCSGRYGSSTCSVTVVDSHIWSPLPNPQATYLWPKKWSVIKYLTYLVCISQRLGER
ncbi:9913_t:CDS:2 [Acaulospora colombiana]|uniref:9913_t:CDS:1 n=1 Tax=Acaulospora colombiana TaxID=27376 RepID=A0ACA9N2V7_9GLOM|nr:9913_t:CDS:2 [Acaulospora colombiana]